MPLLLTLAGLGPAAATPLQSGNILISTGNTLYEYTPAGAWVRTVPIPYPGGTRPTTETARDVVVDASGNLALYNGTFDPYVSQYDVAAGTWTHTTHTGWSTANNASYGGLARYESFVFATDMLTYGTGDSPRGLVRFDLGGSTPVRFADTVDFIDVTLGQDGLLYALASNEYTVQVYDPSTLALVRTLNLPFGKSIRGIAVSQQGEIYGASWDDNIYRFSAAGVQLGQLYSGAYDLIDIDLSAEGLLVVSSRFGNILFTDLQLSSLSSFTVGSAPAFVTFVPQVSDNLLVSSDNSLLEFTANGQLVRTTAIPSNDIARDLTVSTNGRIELYNGTFEPLLSRYDSATGAWTHWTHLGWSTANNVSYGGIASTQHRVFVTDMATAGAGAPRGLVYFDLNTGSAQRFADTVDFIDVTLGQDGLLYALASNEYTVYVYDPSSLALVRTVNLPAAVRAITASTTGELYGASWDDFIYRFSAAGVQLNRVYSGAADLIDIDISPVSQQVAVGSRFGTVILTDLALSTLRAFSAGNSEAFVSFTTPASKSN
ncbi:hypothetical protein DAT35_47610 [Vitiosangium sp. GDMCC 1.1324]|nr:hypothetical protein DAT35_47610 [Vitiosangium sp. GDMCC 1.1324]